jgi:CarD family transcriptional regulator
VKDGESMFSIGDKIVYPMHGAGVIEAVEEKEILGELRKYFVLHVPYNGMKVMIPCNGASQIGVRDIIPKEQVEPVFEVLSSESTEMNHNWNRRFRENMELLKSGDIFSVSEVVRNLMRVDRVKKLSTGEKKMLSDARHILMSELLLVTKDDVEALGQRMEEEIFSIG